MLLVSILFRDHFVFLCRASIAAVDILLENHFYAQSQAPLDTVHNDNNNTGNIASSAENSGKSIFVIGRPPGHHAGPNGCVPSETYWKAPGMTSSGFCLLNTVAIAAVSCLKDKNRNIFSWLRKHICQIYLICTHRHMQEINTVE